MSPRPSVEDARRKEILEAACDAIAERGFAEVRIADIARRAGTSTGTVHYYFINKQDVLQQALRFASERSLQRQIEEIGHLDGARTRLVRLIELNLPHEDEAVQEWVLWMEFWLEALHHPALRPVHEELYGRWRDLVADIVADGCLRGEFTPRSEEGVVVNQFVALMDGLATQVLLHSGATSVDHMRTLLVSFVDAALGPAPVATVSDAGLAR